MTCDELRMFLLWGVSRRAGSRDRFDGNLNAKRTTDSPLTLNRNSPSHPIEGVQVEILRTVPKCDHWLDRKHQRACSVRLMPCQFHYPGHECVVSSAYLHCRRIGRDCCLSSSTISSLVSKRGRRSICRATPVLHHPVFPDLFLLERSWMAPVMCGCRMSAATQSMEPRRCQTRPC